jgi:hypothetical protein
MVIATVGDELPACEISDVTTNPPLDSAMLLTFACAAAGSSTTRTISPLRMIFRLKASAAACDWFASSSETGCVVASVA